jgi:hypothetical protein
VQKENLKIVKYFAIKNKKARDLVRKVLVLKFLRNLCIISLFLIMNKQGRR